MQNTYADIDTDLSKLLHEVARLHVHLGRMSNVGITTRGWSYNELVDGVLGINCTEDIAMKQYRCMQVLFDTLDAIIEIGPRAVSYLHDLKRIA
jgi:hypothetical protein